MNPLAIVAVALLPVPPAALVVGLVARREIRRTGEAGWTLATTAVWVAGVLLGFWLLALVLVAAMVGGLLTLSVLRGVVG